MSTNGPWGSDDAFQLLVLDVVALAGILVGAYQANQADSFSAGLGWMNLAIAGLALSLAASAQWFLRGREMVSLAEASTIRRGLALTGQLAETGPEGDSAVVALKSSHYFHRATCALVGGRRTEALDRAVHQREGRDPCPICQP